MKIEGKQREKASKWDCNDSADWLTDQLLRKKKCVMPQRQLD